MSNKDIELLVDYFNELESIPENLENLVNRLKLINIINESQLALLDLQKEE